MCTLLVLNSFIKNLFNTKPNDLISALVSRAQASKPYNNTGIHLLYRVAPKSSHYRESSLNRIKNRQPGWIFTSFDYKMSTRILHVRIKYSMYDLFVTSSVAVFEAAIWVKSMYIIKS